MLKILQFLLVLCWVSAPVWADLIMSMPPSEHVNDAKLGRTMADDDLREVVEFLRLKMKCGFPAAGIPPLAPLHIVYKDIEVKSKNLHLTGNVSDFSISGLDGFDIVNLHWTHAIQQLKYDFNFPSILFTGDLKFNAAWQLFSGMLDLKGDGQVYLHLENIRATGTLKLRPNGDSGILIHDFYVRLQLGKVTSSITGLMKEAVSRFVNAWLEQFIAIVFGYEEEVSAFFERVMVPPMNAAFVHVRPAALVALMMGLVHDVLPAEVVCAN